MNRDTIAAIATATGVASISIVRVSGPLALEIAKKITKKDNFTPRYAILRDLYNRDNELIDRGIVIYFKAPYSFTGEDIVEFQTHGGYAIAQEILETTIYYGARLAQPGEFSKRAFINGKIDLSEAEAIAKIIESKSIDGAKILAKQLKGELRRFVEESRELLLEILAYSEVMIDYAEEDIPSDLILSIKSKIESLRDKLEELLEGSIRRKGLIEGFELALIGRPNVGKSSILNRLLNYERAIVSDIAGTTRDTIEESIKIGTHLIRIVDTAGIREAKDKIEAIGVERSLEKMENADLAVVIFDGSSPLLKEDREILEKLKEYNKEKVIVVVNKSDLVQKIEIDELREFNPIFISAKKSIKPLLEAIEKKIEDLSWGDDLLLVSSRQIEAVSKTIDALNSSLEPLEREELELFSYHIQEAIENITSISKPFNYEELLDKIFGEFCLGK
ncbi:MAG: tRNA uridine-5-carboxymethylaminomethyl(34) synthesis GTPase MnmE [Epsilonproteobacteria bacterium]|nr:tRNA uridine-5-carboxymethylaminomethyl(34) synthesis GTPase MnmE [Campylobacterota bacterium]